MKDFDDTSPAAILPGPTVSIHHETARIDKRTVETGRARVGIGVTQHDETVSALLLRQDIVIERVTMDKVVTEAPPVRREGDTVIVPILEEVLVTETRLVLREELRIRIDETRRPTTRTVTLRREHATIEQTGSDAGT